MESDSDIISVTSSVTASVSNMSDSDKENSIITEMENLITHYKTLEIVHNDSIKKFNHINNLIRKNANITIEYDNKVYEFDDMLDVLYEKALSNIEETGNNNFTDLLLNVLENGKIEL